jgi:hypothetical protein
MWTGLNWWVIFRQTQQYNTTMITPPLTPTFIRKITVDAVLVFAVFFRCFGQHWQSLGYLY